MTTSVRDPRAGVGQEPKQHDGGTSAGIGEIEPRVEERACRAFGEVARDDAVRVRAIGELLRVGAPVAVRIVGGAVAGAGAERIETVGGFPHVGQPVGIRVQRRQRASGRETEHRPARARPLADSGAVEHAPDRGQRLDDPADIGRQHRERDGAGRRIAAEHALKLAGLESVEGAVRPGAHVLVRDVGNVQTRRSVPVIRSTPTTASVPW